MTFPVDLHVHSLASDGRDSPTRVVERAAEAGVEVLVFADHSVATWSDELAAEGARRGVEVPFAAMEVSVHHNFRKYHLLLYGNGVLTKSLATRCFHPIEYKNAAYRATVDTLRARGIAIPSFDVILAGGELGPTPRHPYKRLGSRTLIAEYVARATGAPLAEARQLVVHASPRPPAGARDPDARRATLAESHLPARDVVAWGKQSGALVALAHPFWECGRFGVTAQVVLDDVAELAAAGVKAIETTSYHHPTPGEAEELLDAAERLGLGKCGGSDYHGNGRTAIGERGLTRDEWERLRYRVDRAGMKKGVA